MKPTPDQLGVALQVGGALNSVGCVWMIGGSVATSAYGEPRATHDVEQLPGLDWMGAPFRSPHQHIWWSRSFDGFAVEARYPIGSFGMWLASSK